MELKVNEKSSAVEEKLLNLLERNVDEYARRYLERLTDEVPEYREAPAALRQESAQSARAIVVRGIAMMRSGSRDLGPEYRAALSALGALRAETGFPLQVALRSFEIGTRVLWDLWIAEAERENLVDAATLQRLFGIGLDMYATCVRDFTESYVRAQETMHGRMFDAINDFLLDVVQGADSKRVGLRATTLGIQLSGHLSLVASPLEGDDCTLPPHLQRILAKRVVGAIGAPGIFGVVGHVGVLVMEGRDLGESGARALETALNGVVRDAPVLTVIGTSREGIDGFRLGLAEVTEVATVARRLNLRGTIRAADLLVQRLLSAAPMASEDIASMLRTLREERNGVELIETLRAFVVNDCNVARTAESIHLHRNSLRYRLRRIESLIGLPITPNRLLIELSLLSDELRK